LSIQNEAISLVAMLSKELRLVLKITPLSNLTPLDSTWLLQE